jgi:hypothetical protein
MTREACSVEFDFLEEFNLFKREQEWTSSREICDEDADHRWTRSVMDAAFTDACVWALFPLLFGSGYSDETVFADLDRLDLDRSNAHKHLLSVRACTFAGVRLSHVQRSGWRSKP